MAEYPTAPSNSNARALRPFPEPQRSLASRLRRVGDSNANYRRGRWTMKRSDVERDVDRLTRWLRSSILGTLDGPIERGRLVPVSRLAALNGASQLQLAVSYAEEARALLHVATDDGPALGWAILHPTPPERRGRKATSCYIPPRALPWARRWVRAVARLRRLVSLALRMISAAITPYPPDAPGTELPREQRREVKGDTAWLDRFRTRWEQPSAPATT